MRWSRYYLYTSREAPADAEVPSHRLMLRAGLVKKVTAGIYAFQPAGWRVLRKLMAVVRREMEGAGAHEMLLPAVQPAELWRETGRWERYGEQLLRIKDRQERDFCFGPTHEEVVTDLLRRELRSYRQLPVTLFQVGTKFRDEVRPRPGLMRSREFLMQDAYSFHATAASLEETYEAMRRAYQRIFDACHLDYTVVEADPGEIGGSCSHELMVVADTGEDVFVRCPEDGYAASLDRAAAGALPAPAPEPFVPLEEVATPGAVTVEEVCRLLEVTPRRLVKTLVYDTDGGLVTVAIRGDREVSEAKLARHLGAAYVTLASAAQIEKATGSPQGFSGPVGLPPGRRLIADESVRGLTNFVCGANRADAHLVGANWGRDAEPGEWADLLLVRGGDPSPLGGGPLEVCRGIEVAHLFQLGTLYSRAMGCTFTDEDGTDRPMVMGCYGMGLGRAVAAAVEQNHDADGIIWPRPLAPFEVLLLALNPDDDAVGRTAEALYGELVRAGVEVLYDDRDERPGAKFKDADLLGAPLRVVVGARSLREGRVELSLRRDREKLQVPRAEAAARVREILATLSGTPAPVPV